MLMNNQSDQAAGLRRIAASHPIRVMAVASGKGGVGKTNVSVNLAMALSAAGKEVMLLDADLGLANVDVLLGLQPRYNLSHVIEGECALEDIIIKGHAGLKIIPASSGISKMARLSEAEYGGLINAFSDIAHSLDVLIVDVAAGLAEGVTTFTRACQEIIVVVCDEPASITDAYALIKVLSNEHGHHRFRVLANMAQTQREGRALYEKLLRVTGRFLDVSLDYLGTIPYDEYLKKAVQKQRAVVDAYPGCRAAKAFKKVAETADKWPIEGDVGGHLQFFFDRLVQRRGSAGMGAPA